MPSFLTFTLAAPLASFGSIAVGERRASSDRPAKSAILGLAAGALGIEREDNEAHAALAHELFYAVRTENPEGPFATPAYDGLSYGPDSAAGPQSALRHATRGGRG